MQDTIIDSLRNHAIALANKPAFTFVDSRAKQSTLTYSQLDQSAQQIAELLLVHGAPGDRVMLLLPQGLEYVETFFACLYAGMIAVPFYPPRNAANEFLIQTIAENCGTNLILTEPRHTASIQNAFSTSASPTTLTPNMAVVCIGSAPNTTPNQDRNLAFLQYTSGSTGSPKGVMVSHRNVIANLRSLQEATHCNASDIFCNWLPLFHDLGLVNTVLLPVFLGAHSILMTPVQFIVRPLTWLNLISDFKATICGAPNFAFEHCVDRIQNASLSTLNLASWRLAFNAAEPIDPETLTKFTTKFGVAGFPRKTFYPSYGMAEATVFIAGCFASSTHVSTSFAKSALQNNKAITTQSKTDVVELVACGQAQTEHHLAIVDPDTHQVLDDGDAGEIWFSGPSVAQGYWNDPEKTQMVFGVYAHNRKEAFLRTGDLGFIHNDMLYISGRIKDVLIIKGQNHYPQDLEKTCASSSDNFRQSGSVAFLTDDNKLVLIQELESKKAASVDHLAACQLIKRLIFETHTLLVDEIVLINSGKLPKTSSGKTQRSKSKNLFESGALETLYKYSSHAAENPQLEFVPPANKTERLLAELWDELLGPTRIGKHSHFFELGGQSLTAVKLVAEITDRFTVTLSLRDLFEHAELGALAAYIDQQTKISPEISVNPAKRNLSAVSPGQKQLWFIDRLYKGSTQYHLGRLYELNGQINIDHLEVAFNAVIDKHKALRTHLLETNGILVGRIQESVHWQLNKSDLSSEQQASQQTLVDELCQQDLDKPFQFDHDIFLRARIIFVKEQHALLFIVVHHVAVDAWSEKILLNDLSQFYCSATTSNKMATPYPVIEYCDFAERQNLSLQSTDLRQQLKYWKSQLEGIPEVHSLPTDYPRKSKQTFAGHSFLQRIDGKQIQALRQIAKTQGVTLFTMLYAAFAVFLHRYSNSHDLVIGTPTSGRDQRDTHDLIGYLVNTLLLRSHYSAELSFAAFAEQCQDTLLNALANQRVPFASLVENLQRTASLSHQPLFQIMLSYAEESPGEPSFSNVKAKNVFFDNRHALFDLTLEITHDQEDLVLRWEYATDLFKAATIKRYAQHFEQLLTHVTAAPDTQISRLSLLSDRELSMLLTDWNVAHAEFLENRPLHENFEAQVKRTPHAIALEYCTDQLTYAELNTAANKLAHYLIRRQVQAGDLVGVCMRPSLDMIVSILAILKTGAAYLPFDPGYPKNRLQYMITDSKTVITLAHLAVAELTNFFECEVVYVDKPDQRKAWEQCSTENPARQGLSAELPAYVIYTSGSTGKPKGTQVFQKGVNNLIHWYTQVCGMHADDRLLLMSAIGFDLTQKNILGPLSVGARLVIPEPRNFDPLFLANIIEQAKITWTNCAPSAFYALLDLQEFQKLATLKNIFLGGEPIDLQKIAHWRQQCDTRLINSYGPTECTDVTAYHVVGAADDYANHSIPIGTPIPNTNAYILDETLQPVPIGVTGELYIGGVCVGGGYLNQPRLTEQKFIKDPFFGAADTLMYKSGDSARWLPNGEIEYLGRLDQQIKIRGFRVELEEISKQLALHSDVVRACTKILCDPAGE